MDFVKTRQENAYTGKKRLSLLFLVQRNGTGDNYQSNSSLCLEKSPRKGKSSHPYGRKPSGQGDIGVFGIAVLANFSCGISVILILNCGITVFSKPAGRVFLAFWSTIVGIKNVSFTFFQPFLAVSGRFGSNLKQLYFIAHFNEQFDCFNDQFKALLLCPGFSSVPPLVIASNFTLLSTNSSAIQAYYEIAVFSGYFCGIAIFAAIICGNAVFSNPQCPPRQALGLCQNNTASTSPSNTRPQISALADKFLFGGDIYVRSCASKSTTKGELSTFLKAVRFSFPV